MKIRHLTPTRLLPVLLCLALVLGAAGPIDFTPSTDAATSAEKRKTRAQKKKIRKLTKQKRLLMQQLAAALTAPPFIEMVTVGNPGNGTDAGNTSEASVYGAVAATFQIGKYEVTNAQYVAFLNAVATTDGNGLFDSQMETDERGGIDQFGSSGNFRYAVRAALGDKPVNWVDFWDACRFCNWLHNGRPSGLQSAGTTETGAYDLTIAGAIAGNTVTRSAGAKFYIPTEDQWYKAAYHQPASAGGDVDDFWAYPTGSNVAPDVAAANAIGEINPDTANIANYDKGAQWDSNGDEVDENGNVTMVGSGGPGSASYYGACDMGGNVSEWNETKVTGTKRGLRGGSWDGGGSYLPSSSRDLTIGPGFEWSDIGFRIASP